MRRVQCIYRLAARRLRHSKDLIEGEGSCHYRRSSDDRTVVLNNKSNNSGANSASWRCWACEEVSRSSPRRQAQRLTQVGSLARVWLCFPPQSRAVVVAVRSPPEWIAAPRTRLSGTQVSQSRNRPHRQSQSNGPKPTPKGEASLCTQTNQRINPYPQHPKESA
jgi:hypothetical protein